MNVLFSAGLGVNAALLMVRTIFWILRMAEMGLKCPAVVPRSASA
jgi:hypothetical protein